MSSKTKNLTLSAVFLTAGIIIPFLCAHMFGVSGNILLPMHIPVLFCGFFCGPKYGSLCGFLTPILSSLLTGMPVLYPMLPIMIAELTVYGLVAGIAYRIGFWGLVSRIRNRIFGKSADISSGKSDGKLIANSIVNIFFALLLAMSAGRIAYGIAFMLLFSLNPSLTAPTVFTAITVGIPGIIIQMILIPSLLLVFEKQAKSSPEVNRKPFDSDVMQQAKGMIATKQATCVILRNDGIIWNGSGKGVSCLTQIYEKTPDLFEKSVVVDKIIGKAAAVVIVLGKASGAYGEIMSVSAREYLQKHNISVDFGRCVDVISNRTGNGICPVEQSILDIDDPQLAYERIASTLENLRKRA